MMFTVRLMNAGTMTFDTVVGFSELCEAVKFIKVHRFVYAVLHDTNGVKIATYDHGKLDCFHVAYIGVL